MKAHLKPPYQWQTGDNRHECFDNNASGTRVQGAARVSQPWMPFYVADYMADTAHLSAAEHGAYLLLIMAYWRNGALPQDEKMLQRISRMTPHQWSQSRAAIAAFFNADWTHDRIESELKKSHAKSINRATSGKLGGEAKALKYKDAALANDILLPKQNDLFAIASSSQPQPDKITEATASGLNGVKNHAVAKRRLRSENDQDLLDRITDIWNLWASQHGSPQVQSLTSQRAIHCRRRIAELMAHGYQTAEEAFRFYLSKVDESFFVLGAPRKKLTFDQFLKENFLAQMLEGAFKYQKQQPGVRRWAS
jgi:uncharacterized protein YdaU (DUF1376 family)